ncbi:MAG: ACT domain-containing protein [Selenomonadaceae bacterium]|nr:ACT domain-containing protein [Selenomonadaceae bacterium]
MRRSEKPISTGELFLVDEGILPEAIRKTIRVKEALRRGEDRTINDAVKRKGLSRSAFYKYKDFVHPFYVVGKEKVVTLRVMLEHRKGQLADLLHIIAKNGGSIVTINQSLPLQGVADITVSLETSKMTVDLNTLLDELKETDGVRRLQTMGFS